MLAQKSGLSVETVKRLERMEGSLEATRVATLEAITVAFEKAGVGFSNGDAPGVHIRSKR